LAVVGGVEFVKYALFQNIFYQLKNNFFLPNFPNSPLFTFTAKTQK
jgi:hypothetical protein